MTGALGGALIIGLGLFFVALGCAAYDLALHKNLPVLPVLPAEMRRELRLDAVWVGLCSVGIIATLGWALVMYLSHRGLR